MCVPVWSLPLVHGTMHVTRRASGSVDGVALRRAFRAVYSDVPRGILRAAMRAD